MNKILLIIQREFLNRVQKKSFLIATILLPLIFPAIMAILVYVAIEQRKNAEKETIYYVDESGFFLPDTSKFRFKKFEVDVNTAKQAFQESQSSYGLLYIPRFDLANPRGVSLYTKVNPSPNEIGDLEYMLSNRIRELKMQKFNIDQKLLDSLKTEVSIQSVNVSEAGQ